MAKPAIVFVCAECGAETLKWQGQCPQCSQLEHPGTAHGRAPPGRAGGRRFTAPADLAELADGRAARAWRPAWASSTGSWAAD